MTAQSGELGGARSVSWAFGHPGVAALVSAVAACAGLVGVIVGLAQRAPLGQLGMLGQLWDVSLVLLSALAFVAGLPASLGFAGASCATQRELWSGILGGFLAVLLTLVVVGMTLPIHGFA